MVSFFKEQSPVAVFGLVIVSIGIRAFFLISPPQVVTTEEDGLIYYPLSRLSTLPEIVLEIIYQAIVIIQALRLNYGLNNIRMFNKPAYTTALAYILLTALVPVWNNITAAIVINSMLIWLFFRIIKLYNAPNPKTLIYNIGLLTGLTILLYFSSFPLVLVMFFALASYRLFRVNEWIILLIGIITPFYFLAGWLFLNDKLKAALPRLTLFRPHLIVPGNLPFTILTFTFVATVIIIGVFLWQANSGRMVIQVRKNWAVLFLTLIVFIPVVFFGNHAWPYALLPGTIPAAAFISNAFVYPKKKIGPAIIFWLFVALIVYNNWYSVKI